MKSLRLLLLFLLLFGMGARAEFGMQADDDFLPVEEAYQLSIEQDQGNLMLIWQIADGYYLYRHGFEHQWLVNGKARQAEVQVPNGVERHDEYFGDVEVYYRQAVLTLALPEGIAADDELTLKASSQGCADAGLCYPPYHQYFRIEPGSGAISAVDAPVEAGRDVAGPAREAGSVPPTLVWVLLAAVLGGLILNLMPCVFPVLSIKALQLTRQHEPAVMRLHALLYMAGVIISFMLIAALMLFLRRAGDAVGWGFQLQNPWFVASLVYLFFVLSLNMAGIIQFGMRWMGVGQSLTAGGDKNAAFFTGVLAVLVASPCTAPFMGSALGYAMTQSAPMALLAFAALGLGMALPLTLLGFVPQLASWLPKPGPWMERLKQFFAFPLLVTAVWLLWVLGNQSGTTAMMVILLGCILLLFAFWCFRGAVFSRAVGLMALLLALSLPFSERLAGEAVSTSYQHETFTEERLAGLRREGVPVFIDLTADWCITCLANEKSTLHTEAVQQAFQDAGIVYMVGDWTNYNPEITALLGRYQRSGIPLYLLYPPEPNAPPMILPQLLSKRIILDAVEGIK